MQEMTRSNLKEAFAGESQAYMKYTIFADKAEQEGYPEVARLFRAIAYAERVHATNHLKGRHAHHPLRPGSRKDPRSNVSASPRVRRGRQGYPICTRFRLSRLRAHSHRPGPGQVSRLRTTGKKVSPVLAHDERPAADPAVGHCASHP